MKIYCPQCKAPVAPASIHIAKAVGRCEACAMEFPLQPLVGTSQALLAPPDGTRVNVTRSEGALAIVLPCSGFQGMGCGVPLFAMMSFSVAIALHMHLAEQEHTNDGATAAVVAFAAVAVVLFFISIYIVCGYVVVEMTRESLNFERRIFGIRQRDTYKLNEIDDIRSTTVYPAHEGFYCIGIHLRGSGPLKFASALTEREKSWLMSEMLAFWKRNREGEGSKA